MDTLIVTIYQPSTQDYARSRAFSAWAANLKVEPHHPAMNFCGSSHLWKAGPPTVLNCHLYPTATHTHELRVDKRLKNHDGVHYLKLIMAWRWSDRGRNGVCFKHQILHKQRSRWMKCGSNMTFRCIVSYLKGGSSLQGALNNLTPMFVSSIRHPRKSDGSAKASSSSAAAPRNRIHQAKQRAGLCAISSPLERPKDNHQRINTAFCGFASPNSDHASVVIYFISVLSLFIPVQDAPVDLLIFLPFWTTI